MATPPWRRPASWRDTPPRFTSYTGELVRCVDSRWLGIYNQVFVSSVCSESRRYSGAHKQVWCRVAACREGGAQAAGIRSAPLPIPGLTLVLSSLPHITPSLFCCTVCSAFTTLLRFDYLEASKVMQRRALSNPKIEVGGEGGGAEWQVGGGEGLSCLHGAGVLS